MCRCAPHRWCVGGLILLIGKGMGIRREGREKKFAAGR